MPLLSDPAALLLIVSYAAMLAGIALIMFAPAAPVPGVAVAAAGVLAYVAYHSVLAQTLAGMSVLSLLLFIAVTAAALSVRWWTDRLGVRSAYVNQQVMWGALIGSFVGIFIFGIVGMLLGMIVGTLVMELRGGRSFQDSLRQGVATLYSMLGPRGFQLVMALVLATIAMRSLGTH